MNKLRVFYVWDDNLIVESDRLPAVVGRASLVHELITTYGLLDHMRILKSSPASYNELKGFHSELYLDHLKSLTSVDDEYMSTSQDEEYGIGYDCPPLSNMFELVSTLAGGSITAAKSLVLGLADVAINWCGGWHHAQRFGAEGFCYINDIVLAIEVLRRKYTKVLYIDLDVHHGNGVQDAYNLSKSVFTLSIHKYEPGFYPGTGDVTDVGNIAGTGYACNVPLREAYSDQTMEYVFDKVFTKVCDLFKPKAFVIQCGADALAHDPHGGANLTIKSYSTCVTKVLDRRKPALLLGGGGYKFQNAARLWTSLTALATGVVLDENIPEHSHWPQYGPDYKLLVEPTLVRDTNNKNYLDEYLNMIAGNLVKYLAKNDVSEEPETNKQKTNDTKGMPEEKVNRDSKKQDVEKENFRVPDRNSKSVDVYDFTDD